jgi:hypothetical protein
MKDEWWLRMRMSSQSLASSTTQGAVSMAIGEQEQQIEPLQVYAQGIGFD